MKKTIRIIAICMLGALPLLFFQNCGGSFQAQQAMENFMSVEDRKKHDDSDTESNATLQVLKAAAGSSCLASELKFAWPFGGTPYSTWTNYFYIDDDATTGILDYTGALGANAITYNGHKGIDIDVPNFRAMDANFPVLAAAAGTVVGLYQGSFDRNTSCSSDPWNYVSIRHANGYLSTYGHLKKNSVVVVVGQQVVAGQKIGVVGSSGCSTGPHTHFEVRDCNNFVVDSLKANMFLSPLLYARQAPAKVMDLILKQPKIASSAELKDPGLDVPTVHSNLQFTYGLALSNFKVNDVLTVTTVDPNGALRQRGFTITNTTFYALSKWWGNPTFDVLGVWHTTILINGVQVGARDITVVP